MDSKKYDKIINECKRLVISRNKNYGNSVDYMSIDGLVELIMMKLSRIKQLGEAHPKTLDELQDSLNYIVFCLEKYKQKEVKNGNNRR